VSRTELLRDAWNTTFLAEKTVDVHLASLRRKVGTSLKVTALRGVGYRMEAE
jgi:DNA-binding response OmpR family regulator